GVQDGAVVRGAPEEIRLAGSRVEWSEEADKARVRAQAWTELASPLLEGEVVNGIDDNGNGWIDERGLAIELDGARATLSVTVERPGPAGPPIPGTPHAA